MNRVALCGRALHVSQEKVSLPESYRKNIDFEAHWREEKSRMLTDGLTRWLTILWFYQGEAQIHKQETHCFQPSAAMMQVNKGGDSNEYVVKETSSLWNLDTQLSLDFPVQFGFTLPLIGLENFGYRSMVNRKKNMTKGRRKTGSREFFKGFPKDLLTEVLARVASTSFSDLFTAKLSCKEFLEAASENYIHEHITIEKFPVIPWRISHGASSFLDRCKENGNPEALFRQGMVEFFSSKKPESGFQHLKNAARKGHAEAKYICGIILVCHGGQFKQEGIELLTSLKNCRSRHRSIKECRNKIKGILQSMWIDKSEAGIGPEEPENHGRTCNCSKFTNRGWIEEEEYTTCDDCVWDHEATLFCKILRARGFGIS
ncbi:hypothetical protein SADUNF_Sadunf13G0007700 [Salix dunnii]|uniref:At2g35280-like TPR domain-containing protein n=1 Tax=Salix dunnii TaxID=1413687 RepID=A0A835JK36_9ROSI|nr:hypothetical protein SADUNF_Sadunf13G0007700 [Salix dunnii]